MKAISDVKMKKIIQRLLKRPIFGRFPNPTASTLFAVGNGTSDTNRSNALEVLEDGTTVLQRAVLGSDLCGNNLPEPGTPGRVFFLKAPKA